MKVDNKKERGLSPLFFVAQKCTKNILTLAAQTKAMVYAAIFL